MDSSAEKHQTTPDDDFKATGSRYSSSDEGIEGQDQDGQPVYKLKRSLKTRHLTVRNFFFILLKEQNL